jgi:hypothetical protein
VGFYVKELRELGCKTRMDTLKNHLETLTPASILASEGIRREQRICRTFSAGAMSTEKGKKL